MPPKAQVINYVTGKFQLTQPQLYGALRSMLDRCDETGMVQQLANAYLTQNPELVIQTGADVASGAHYDFGQNQIKVKPSGDPLAVADNFLFESFNCAHRADYKALKSRFGKFSFPPMYFMEYGREMARIEAGVVYEYVSLLREIAGNARNARVTPPFTGGARRALKKNDGLANRSQFVARMAWTPHDPDGVGYWRFASPEHYAFTKATELRPGDVGIRVKHLTVQAAGRAGYGAYNDLDPNQRFQKWWQNQWSGLQPDHKPTSFVTICVEANRVFAPVFRRPIRLKDYEFTTAMELEARRLLKRATLGRAPAP